MSMTEPLSGSEFVEGTRKFASWYIDTGEKFANAVLDLQSATTKWAKETPLGPVFEAQNDFARKLVKQGSETARNLWQRA